MHVTSLEFDRSSRVILEISQTVVKIPCKHGASCCLPSKFQISKIYKIIGSLENIGDSCVWKISSCPQIDSLLAFHPSTRRKSPQQSPAFHPLDPAKPATHNPTFYPQLYEVTIKQMSVGKSSVENYKALCPLLGILTFLYHDIEPFFRALCPIKIKFVAWLVLEILTEVLGSISRFISFFRIIKLYVQ